MKRLPQTILKRRRNPGPVLAQRQRGSFFGQLGEAARRQVQPTPPSPQSFRLLANHTTGRCRGGQKFLEKALEGGEVIESRRILSPRQYLPPKGTFIAHRQPLNGYPPISSLSNPLLKSKESPFVLSKRYNSLPSVLSKRSGVSYPSKRPDSLSIP